MKTNARGLNALTPEQKVEYRDRFDAAMKDLFDKGWLPVYVLTIKAKEGDTIEVGGMDNGTLDPTEVLVALREAYLREREKVVNYMLERVLTKLFTKEELEGTANDQQNQTGSQSSDNRPS